LTPRTIDTLGYKQNNPGNIRRSAEVFDGEISSFTAFKSFNSMRYGYRALAIILYNYFKRGNDTIRKMITVYSPPSENDTAAYIRFVSEQTGIPADKRLSISDFQSGVMIEAPVKKIVRAISQQEISWSNEKELSIGYNEFLKDRL
jgi:hypothetical protein